jgi:hypothetical protein
MVSLRSGKAVNGSSTSKKSEGSQKPKPQQKANISKKRKAETEAPEEDKENEVRPSTPPPKPKAPAPPLGDSELANMPGYERTPGRVGPIKPEDRNCRPNIEPFKGPKGKKVRKTAWEKDEEFKQFAREHECLRICSQDCKVHQCSCVLTLLSSA